MNASLTLPAVEAGGSLTGAPPGADAKALATANGDAFKQLLATLLGTTGTTAAAPELPESAIPAPPSEDQPTAGDPAQAILASLLLPFMTPAFQSAPTVPTPATGENASGTVTSGAGVGAGSAWSTWPSALGVMTEVATGGGATSEAAADARAITAAANGPTLAAPAGDADSAALQSAAASALAAPSVGQALADQGARIAGRPAPNTGTAPLHPGGENVVAVSGAGATGATPLRQAGRASSSELFPPVAPEPTSSPAGMGEHALSGAGSETAAPPVGAAVTSLTPPTADVSAAESARTAGAPLNADALDAVVQQARMTATPGRSSLRLRLTPESLGQVDITIDVTRQGATVRLTAASPEARAAIEQHLPLLRSALEAGGFAHERLTLSTDVSASALAGGGSLGLAGNGMSQRQATPWSLPAVASPTVPATPDAEPAAWGAAPTTGLGLVDYRA